MADHLSTAARLAARFVDEGALGVVLVGSHARGDALPTSDLDLVVLAASSAPHRLELHDGHQVSITQITPARVRELFSSPADAGGAVPAWRGALLLTDPSGQAAVLQSEALAWDWSQVAIAADRWVATEVTLLAEEVHRMIGQAEGGSARAAAVMRSLLAFRLAPILAVHHRILYDSENRIWDLVASLEGPDWTAAQDAALGLADGDPARAAFDLYAMTVHRVASLLDPDQAAVTDAALALNP